MKKIIALMLLAAMLLSALTGCDSTDYKAAAELRDGGSYAEAARMFEALGDYKDSADQALLCRYAHATALFQAGEYTQAADAFAALGDYQDSAAMVSECGYQNAEALLSAGSYEQAIAAYEALGSYKDSAAKLLAATQELMYITYADVFAALSEGVWFYAGASADSVMLLTFTPEEATVAGIYGTDIPDAVVCGYVVDDAAITVDTADGALTIPYTLESGEVILEPGVYFTPAQIEEALQGYWGLRTTSSFGDSGPMHNEYIYCIDNGTITYERAADAYISGGYLYTAGIGAYYYFEPRQGTYVITEKGIEADITNGEYLRFAISGGEIIFTLFSKNCERYEGFKGQYGFVF